MHNSQHKKITVRLVATSEPPAELAAWFQDDGIDGTTAAAFTAAATFYTVTVENIQARAAAIIRQEAAARGMPCAVPPAVRRHEPVRVSIVLAGNRRQFLLLARKLYAQPFGLPIVARRLLAALPGPTAPGNKPVPVPAPDAEAAGWVPEMHLVRPAGDDLVSIFLALGADRPGARLMANKAEMLLVKIDEMPPALADELKTRALAVGADLAIARTVAAFDPQPTGAVLLATRRQAAILARALAASGGVWAAMGAALQRLLH